MGFCPLQRMRIRKSTDPGFPRPGSFPSQRFYAPRGLLLPEPLWACSIPQTLLRFHREVGNRPVLPRVLLGQSPAPLNPTRPKVDPIQRQTGPARLRRADRSPSNPSPPRRACSRLLNGQYSRGREPQSAPPQLASEPVRGALLTAGAASCPSRRHTAPQVRCLPSLRVPRPSGRTHVATRSTDDRTTRQPPAPPPSRSNRSLLGTNSGQPLEVQPRRATRAGAH